MKSVVALAVLFIWAYGIYRAETGWKYVPFVGTVIGAVCVIEDFSPKPMNK